MLGCFERERAVAEAAVFRAAVLTKKVQSQVSAVAKADATPVTVADFAAQALLISALHSAFPGDGFVGEESSSVLRSDAQLRDKVYELVVSSSSSSSSSTADNGGDDDATGGTLALASPSSVEDMLNMIDLGGSGQGGPSGRFWVTDPIDGTATFLRGHQYAVSLALIEDGREVVGVLACPSLRVDADDDGGIYDDEVDRDGLGVLLTAVRGQGVTIRHFSPSQTTTAAAAAVAATGLLLSSLSPAIQMPAPLVGASDLAKLRFVDCQRSKSANHGLVRRLAGVLGARYPGLDLWSSHMRYAALVLGGADAWVRLPAAAAAAAPVFYIWDNAGAQLIFTEMGGTITDFDGRPIDFGAGRTLSANKGMIAARANVHDVIFKMANELLAADTAAAKAKQ